MADGTSIEWTDATWNVITGCSVISPGCTNCYAMKLAGTRLKNTPSRKGLTIETKAGPVWNGEVRFNESMLDQPLHWRRPRRIFVCAHADLFHEAVPDEWIDQVFAVMALCPQHSFQVLTKRPERMRDYLTTARLSKVIWNAADDLACKENLPEGLPGDPYLRAGRDEARLPLPNVWLGVSVEDQARADERIPILLDTPAAVRWISAEPLLGSIDLRFYLSPHGWQAAGEIHSLDWVVVGGESGPGARPMHPNWARSLCDQCAAAGVPFLFKQWGEWAPDTGTLKDGSDPVVEGRARAAWWNAGSWRFYQDGYEVPREIGRVDDVVYRVGKKRAGRTLDGVIHDAWPEVFHD